MMTADQSSPASGADVTSAPPESPFSSLPPWRSSRLVRLRWNWPRVASRALLLIGVALAIEVVMALFSAYQQPSMLIDFSNLLFCG